MLTSGSQVEELKRHLFGIFKISNKVMKEGETENEKSMREGKMMKAREALEKIQLTESLPGPLSSPRNRTKFVREFNMTIDKLISSTPGKIDEKVQENVEKALSDLVQAVDSDQKMQESCLNLDQFCALQGPQKLIDLLLDWTKNGLSLRLCIRICHSLCVFLKDPRVAYAVIFKPELLKLVDKVIELILTLKIEESEKSVLKVSKTNQPDTKSPQLSALLDVLSTCLKSASQRIAHLSLQTQPLKHQLKLNKELQKLDHQVLEAIFAVGDVLTFSINSDDIRNALSRSKGPVLLATRILGLAEHANQEFLSQVSTAILEHVYIVKRAAELPGKLENVDHKSVDGLVSMVISSYSQNSAIMKSCFIKNSENLIMMIVLIEDSMWKCAQRIREQGNIGERPWGTLTKDEELLCKLSQQLGNVVGNMEQWQKRSAMVSWTTGNSSCLHILLHKIPIRLLAIGKHSKRIVPTVTDKIMDRLTNSEKSQMFGDMSSDWFFENSLFPGRSST
ncbi:hypothetical protein CRE_28240 [Caenorhabditis remanei]|uniref:Uncharacterized protein n=1 Tax=Caenorhabditis remanei TaxID=31234 RepID=E3LLP7_CAERE|nr:hypothetical protein CRE_28240 [Caenorhabditis remanei]